MIGVILGIIQASILSVLIFPSITFNDLLNGSFLEEGLEDVLDAVEEKSKGFINEIVIYNGTTIEDGIRSNKNIDSKAIQLTQEGNTDREKAEILYEWIGSNIKYDDKKAEVVLSGAKREEMPESGAICAFNTRTGVCFDKACLYVAMARAAGLKVRLISGEAFDGEKYVGHAWNQVYLKDENNWINVDTTFYEAGNYFDSNLFNEHKVDSIVGEWK